MYRHVPATRAGLTTIYIPLVVYICRQNAPCTPPLPAPENKPLRQPSASIYNSGGHAPRGSLSERRRWCAIQHCFLSNHLALNLPAFAPARGCADSLWRNGIQSRLSITLPCQTVQWDYTGISIAQLCHDSVHCSMDGSHFSVYHKIITGCFCKLKNFHLTPAGEPKSQ